MSLKGFASLEKLWLREIIAADFLEYLLGQPETNVTDAGVADLKRAIPRLKVFRLIAADTLLARRRGQTGQAWLNFYGCLADFA